ncbi:MAG: hypothetical protein Q7U40_09290, partial [Desulfatirhabdiaceae bacterium]|nr:hypothetical protein [Desulfatirhabdiaceae bacterium]
AIWGCQSSEDDFVKRLHQTLMSTPTDPFEIEKKLPFSAKLFRAALLSTMEFASPVRRREIDILAGFGSEVHFDEKDVFEDTAFRMVRSGDSAGQGLPAYALAIRKHIDIDALNRTLFQNWDYRDDDFSLRWDPIEDQRYALRWYNPSSETNKKYALKTMRGANALSLEALALFPVQPQAFGKTATTCFSWFSRKREFFTWPIWDQPISLDIIRALLSLSDLHNSESPPRQILAKRGIVEIYRCERIAPNKYYKNFTPAVPT